MADPSPSVEAAEFGGTDRFEVVRRIGAGGMGVVYEVLDRERGRHAALKTLRTWSADSILRFKNEFRALQDLRHPNLVALGELFEDHGQWFFTMELVDGVQFLGWVRPGVEPPPPIAPGSEGAAHGSTAGDTSQPTLPGQHAGKPQPMPEARWHGDEKRLRDALGQLALGLDALHAARMVHRDVKPSNILVTPAGRVVVLDFGLVTEAAGPHQRWPERHLVGTASYMAPEQATGQPVEPSADWYSLGVVLYQALTGRLPIAGPPEKVIQLKQAVEPSPPDLLVPNAPPDLARLCADLLKIDPKRRPPGREVLARLQVKVEASRGRSEEPHFIGRRGELEVLERAIEQARTGEAKTVVVLGESGVGKSALLKRFGDQVAERDGRAAVFSGRCHERESVPYRAVDGIVDSLSRFLAILPPPYVETLLPGDAALLGQVFPVMRRLAPVASAPRAALDEMEPQELRTRLFAALRDLLGRIARRHPLVLLVDDLQWADADGLALLGALTRPPESPPLTLVATVRATPSLGEAGEPAVVKGLPGPLERLPVEPLPAAEAERLATLLVEGAERAGEVSATAIAKEAGGHPLFIDELVRARLVLGAASVPLKLEDALWARIGRLDERTRAALELVAVAGAPLDQETAAHAAALDFGAFAEQAAELRASRLVKVSGARRSDAIEPYHDRVRDAVLVHLDATARSGWHRRLALALEAAPRADAEALSVHWRGAGDAEKAGGYAARAAEEAAEAFAFDRAARLFALALELGQPGDREGAMRVKLGDALANAGRGAEAADAYLAALALRDSKEALDLKRLAAEQLLRTGHIDRGLELLAQVLQSVGARMPDTPRGALVSLLYRRARVRLRGLHFQERPADAVPPAALARIDAYWAVAGGLAIVDTIRGADFQARGLQLALDAGEPYRAARALSYEAGYYAAIGGSVHKRADELLATAGAIAERIGHPHALGVHAGCAGVAAFLLGRWKDGHALCDRAEEIFQSRCTGVAWELHTSRQYALISLAYLGRFDELARRFPQRLREAEERGNLYARTTLRTALSNLVWLAHGEEELFASELADAMRSWSRSGFHLQHYWYLMSGCHLDLYARRGRAAHERLREQWRALERSLLLRIQVVRVEALDLRARAALAAANGAGADRSALLTEAARAARRIGREKVAYALPLAERLRAQVAHAEGRAAEAAEWHARAIAGFDAADMALHAAVCRARRGALVGGDEGRAEVDRAAKWFAAQHVKRPAAMIDLICPGPIAAG